MATHVTFCSNSSVTVESEQLMLLLPAAALLPNREWPCVIWSRLLVEELNIGAMQLVLDVHVAEASPQRIPLDAHAIPVLVPCSSNMCCE
jgi:hypothetical protein